VVITTKHIKGDYTKNIEVETNDPGTPVLKLTMKAKIVEILAVTPMDVNFGTVKTGSINKKTFTIANKGKEPLTITSISANPSTMLSVSHQGKVKLEPDKSISVEVRFQAGPPTDFFFGTFHIETDQEAVKAKDARIKAKVVGN
jgi:hypothetical protein